MYNYVKIYKNKLKLVLKHNTHLRDNFYNNIFPNKYRMYLIYLVVCALNITLFGQSLQVH